MIYRAFHYYRVVPLCLLYIVSGMRYFKGKLIPDREGGGGVLSILFYLLCR